MKKVLAFAWLFTVIAACLWMVLGIYKLDESVSELHLASAKLDYEITAMELAITAIHQKNDCGDNNELENK